MPSPTGRFTSDKAAGVIDGVGIDVGEVVAGVGVNDGVGDNVGIGVGVGRGVTTGVGVGLACGEGRVVGSGLFEEFGLGVFVLLLLPFVDGDGVGVT